MNLLSVKHLTKSYPSGNESLTVLSEVTFSVDQGQTLSVVGPSGSGKTTLLGLCAGLDRPSRGVVTLRDIVLNELSEDELAQVRNQYVGFVFQNFQLIPTLTAVENVMVPIELSGQARAYDRARSLLGRVGLDHRLNHYPAQLSGGEQQRVAIARAFANDPVILFADEPTGNLDEETGHKIISLLFEINKEKNTTLVIVTHDSDLADRTHQIIRLKGGRITDES